jgi:hypothetical protein
MSSLQPRTAPPVAAVHPAVLDRRLRELLLVALSALVPLAIGLALDIATPQPNLFLTLAMFVGAVGLVWLVASPRLEVTVTVLAIYLGMLDGPVKLLSSGGQLASGLRNILVVGVGVGALLRLVVKRERITFPPLSGWVLGLVAIVVVEAFNPQTTNILKFFGGVRQQLQWVPFFFFGYVLVRSTSRFRKMFIILGVMALANAAVATYQTRLSPGQLASWGPGYHNRIYGTEIEGKKKGGHRVYAAGGEAHVRPPALGSDSGFSGGVGVLALPGSLALLALWRIRRRWIPLVLVLGALVGIATSLGRTQVIGGAVGVIAFAALSSSLGKHMTRPVMALLGVIIIALPLGALFVAIEGSSTFKRYESIASPEKAVGASTGDKAGSLSLLPHQLTVAPFGVGLGTVGVVAGFGGHTSELLEGHTVSAETQFNFISDELGLPGLILWVLFVLDVMFLAARRLWRIADPALRLSLAAVTAPLISQFAMSFVGPTTVGTTGGPYLFFATGIIAYWFAGPGWQSARIPRGREARSLALTPAVAPALAPRAS